MSGEREVVVMLRTFGQHRDGAPKAYGLLYLDEARVRALLEAVEQSRPQRPPGQERVRKPEDVGLRYVRVRDTQRRPYYKEFRQTFEGIRDIGWVTPQLVEHLETIDSEREKVSLTANSVSWIAYQPDPEKEMFSRGVAVDDLYRALASLQETPEGRAAVGREMAEEKPRALIEWLEGDWTLQAPGEVIRIEPPAVTHELLRPMLSSEERSVRLWAIHRMGQGDARETEARKSGARSR